MTATAPDPRTLIDPALRPARHEAIRLGMSGANVYRVLDADDRTIAYAKLASPPDLVAELNAEAERLTWLAAHNVPVAEVLAHDTADGVTWLATRALPGQPASDPWPDGRHAYVVDTVAEAARALHETAIDDCPFDQTLPTILDEAERRIKEGLVARAWEANGYAREPENALHELKSYAVPTRLAVTHGDYCLPNVLVDGNAHHFVDLGRAGLADPHADLALMVGSLRNDINPQFTDADAERFLDAYGRDAVNDDLVHLHDLLERFFWRIPSGRIDG